MPNAIALDNARREDNDRMLGIVRDALTSVPNVLVDIVCNYVTMPWATRLSLAPYNCMI